MANLISKIKLPDGATYTVKDLSSSATAYTLTKATWNTTNKTYALTISGCLATDVAEVYPNLDGQTASTINDYAEQFNKIILASTTANTLTLTASSVPTTDIKIYVKGVKH